MKEEKTPKKKNPREINRDTFWRTIVNSPQWKKWYDEQVKRFARHVRKNSKVFTGCFDVDECQECGIISPRHFQEFIKFIKRKNN